MEINKPPAWDPAMHFYMGKDIPNFLDLMESHIITYNNISLLGVIPPDLLVGDLEKEEIDAADVRALDYFVHIMALVSEEGNHGVGLSTDRSALCNGILG